MSQKTDKELWNTTTSHLLDKKHKDEWIMSSRSKWNIPCLKVGVVWHLSSAHPGCGVGVVTLRCDIRDFKSCWWSDLNIKNTHFLFYVSSEKTIFLPGVYFTLLSKTNNEFNDFFIFIWNTWLRICRMSFGLDYRAKTIYLFSRIIISIKTACECKQLIDLQKWVSSLATTIKKQLISDSEHGVTSRLQLFCSGSRDSVVPALHRVLSCI